MKRGAGPHVLLIASAGGHLAQAIIMLSPLKDIDLASDRLLSNDSRFRNTYRVLNTQFNPLVHLVNTVIALRVLARTRPDVVVSTGGAICLPFAGLCKVLSIPFIFIDTMSRVQDLSNTAKFIHRFNLCKEMVVQWPQVARRYNRRCYGTAFNIGDGRDE